MPQREREPSAIDSEPQTHVAMLARFENDLIRALPLKQVQELYEIGVFDDPEGPELQAVGLDVVAKLNAVSEKDIVRIHPALTRFGVVDVAVEYAHHLITTIPAVDQGLIHYGMTTVATHIVGQVHTSARIGEGEYRPQQNRSVRDKIQAMYRELWELNYPNK